MLPDGRPTRALIHLDRLIANYREAQRLAGDRAVVAVVKGDAYGHGAVPVARALQTAGCIWFGVATLDEAVQLRESGIHAEILLLGALFPGEESEALAQGVTCSVPDEDTARRLHAAALRLDRRAAVHLKIDTGMARLGFDLNGFAAFARSLAEYPALTVRGLFSHPLHADQPDPGVTREQGILLSSAADHLLKAVGEVPHLHLANSAALMFEHPVPGDLVRPGIMLYGGYPAEALRARGSLQPVMEFTSAVVQIRRVRRGQSVSYGASWVAGRDSIIGVVPAGYADGVARRLSNAGQVTAGGRRVPVAGRVCMDMFMVDLTDVAGAETGMPVTLFGGLGPAAVTADEWGDWTGTIAYEVCCNVSHRVPRVYLGESEAGLRC